MADPLEEALLSIAYWHRRADALVTPCDFLIASIDPPGMHWCCTHQRVHSVAEANDYAEGPLDQALTLEPAAEVEG